MVENSEIMIGMVGGEIAGDELLSAKKLERKDRFTLLIRIIKKQLNLQRKKDRTPKDFRGAAHSGFYARAKNGHDIRKTYQEFSTCIFKTLIPV